MPLNSFDDAIDQLAKDGDIETGVAPKNPYDDAIDSYIGSRASAVQNSAWVAKDKDPVRTAKVLEISKREGYDPSFVERNFDTLSKAGTTEDQYKRLTEKAPGLARWMEKPEYAAISRGDEANLAELENQLSSMTKEKPKESWLYLPSEMAEQARAGFYDMNIGANLNLGLFGDPAQRKTVAKAIASDFQKQSAFSGNEPSYLQEFRRVAQDQAGDMGLAYYRAVNGWREMRAGMWLQGLQDLSFGATMTLGEGVEFLKLLAHPRGLMTEGARVFSSSAPAALGGLAGSLAGPLGVAGGVSAGTTMISTSGRAMEMLRNQGVDFSNEESILSALNDDKLMAKVRADAFRGGFAEGLVSGAFAGVSGSKVANALSGTAGKVSKMQVAKSAVLEAVKEMGGETVEGLGGDIAQSKGDLASVDLAQNVMEGVLSFGSSGTTVAAGTISRGADMALIKARSYEVSKKVDLAMSAIDDAQRMEVASLVLEDSKTNQLSPDSVKEFMASVGGPDGKVFFQSRDWDAYFKKQNVSPVEALEAISPSAALKYTEKATTGGSIEIPVADFLSNVYNTPHKKELIKIMRSTPGSMSLAESVEAFKTLPDDVRNVLSDAMFLRDNPVRAEPQTETEAKISEFENRVTEDLVRSGDKRSKARDRAKIFGSMVRAMSSRSTFSVDEIISKYGFNVSRGTSELSADGQTYDQPGYHGSPEGKSELKAVEINNADGSKSFGWGIYFSAKKALAEFYRKERSVEGKKSSLLTYDVPEDYELLDRDKKISEQSEQVRAALPDAKPDETGGEYYDRIARKLTPEMASRTLASKGVKGLRYNDTTAKMAIGEDATNFVVFDDKFIKQMDKVFYQKQLKTDTKAFKDWFGDSKVVDENGQPLVVYHGTRSEFDAFQSERPSFFTDAPGVASAYSMRYGGTPTNDTRAMGRRFDALRERLVSEGVSKFDVQNSQEWKDLEDESRLLKSSVVPVFLRLNNPFVVTPGSEVFSETVKNKDSKAFHEQLKAQGYDGIIIRNTIDAPGIAYTKEDADAFKVKSDIFIPFSPEQIKSVFNKGTFDPNDPRILKQDDARGRITIRPDRTMDIELLAKADDSTFFHEMGHAFLEVMADIAELEDSDAQVKEDFEGLLKWLGVESRDQIGTEQHEQFARGFEAFLMEGKAPSMRLRNVFYRAQMWLINVYKKLVDLDVELTPEVRNIMGRMIATEEELTRVAEAKKTKALFSGIETFGLPQNKVERYVTAIQDAEAQAVQLFNAKMFENYRQEKRRFLDKERKRIKGELESKYEKTQGAMAYKSVTGAKDLPEGARNIKLDRKSYTESFGKEAADALPNKAFGKGGFRPDEAAAILGFRSGKQLSEALTAESNRSQMIDFETEAMLANEYGDLMAQADMSDEAYEALQNDSRTKLLELELDMLATENLPAFKDMVKEITNRPSITARDVKDYVDAALGETSLRDISPRKFEIAENKSSTEAGKALTAGDRDAAYLAHKNTLIQHQFYKRSIEIRSEVEKAQRDFQKVFKSDEDMAKTKDLDYVNAARALLASVGMGQAEKSPAEYLAQTKSYDPATYETMAALLNATLTDVAGKDFKDLTYDQFYSLKTTTNALMEMARETRKVTLGGERQSLEDVAKALSEQVQTNIPKPKGDRKNTTVTDADKLSVAYSSVKAGLRIMGSMADEVDRGDQLGIFNKVFVREVKNSLHEYRASKKEVLSRFDAILKEIAPTLTTDEIEAGEFQDSEGKPFVFQGRAELVGALLHVGNESNFRKLLVGRKWGSVEEDGVTLNRSKWDAFIKRMHQEGKITKADWDAVQKIWDLFEELKPGVQRAHKRLYGHYFSEITASPVATPFGEYRGGYFPARSDPFEVDRAATYEMKEMMESNASYAFPTAGRGATKSRIERYAAPLSLNLRLTLAHADWALRFAYLEPTVKELGRIVQNDSFRGILDERLPQASRDVIIPYLQRVVTQRITTPSGASQSLKLVDRALTKIRRNAAFGVMFGNFANAAQQFTGISVAAAYKVDGKRLGRRVLGTSVDYSRNPKAMADFVTSKSSEMKNRMISQAIEMQRRIDDYLLNPSKYEKAKDWAYQNAYILQSATQNIVDTITWTSAFSKAMEKKGRSEADAVFIADKAVITTQGSSNPEDVSQFISGTPILRSILMFQNYSNIIGNYLVTDTRNTMRDLGIKNKYADLFTLYALVLLAPAALSGVLKKAASGKLDEDDDDEYLDDAVDVMLGEPARQVLGFVPFVGQGLEATVNRFDNKWYNDQIRMSPVIDTLINKAPGVPRTIGKAFTSEEIKKRDITDAISVINALIGVPIGPLSRPIGYAYSVSEGKTEPANAADFVRGLVVGR